MCAVVAPLDVLARLTDLSLVNNSFDIGMHVQYCHNLSWDIPGNLKMSLVWVTDYTTSDGDIPRAIHVLLCSRAGLVLVYSGAETRDLFFFFEIFSLCRPIFLWVHCEPTHGLLVLVTRGTVDHKLLDM